MIFSHGFIGFKLLLISNPLFQKKLLFFALKITKIIKKNIMKKIFRNYAILSFTVAAVSCSGPQIEDKWWYADKEKGDDIIMFSTQEGKLINLNDSDSESYEGEGEEITVAKIGDDENQVFLMKIGEVTDEKLVLNIGDENLEFRAIKNNSDYLIGKWKGTFKGEKLRLTFRKDGEYREKFDGERNKGEYSATEKEITLESKTFSYTLSSDIMTLNLIFTGGEEVSLSRRYGTKFSIPTLEMSTTETEAKEFASNIEIDAKELATIACELMELKKRFEEEGGDNESIKEEGKDLDAKGKALEKELKSKYKEEAKAKAFMSALNLEMAKCKQ